MKIFKEKKYKCICGHKQTGARVIRIGGVGNGVLCDKCKKEMKQVAN